MFILRRLARLSRTIQFALVAVAAFAIGSATVAAASTAGIPVGSLFYLPMINGAATTPCSTATSTLGATTTCNAIVDSNGNLHVTGNSTVSGTVGVNNFPGDQQVHGSVGITNLPADQQIHGMVGINNFPGIQAVNGTVNVGNLPTDSNGNLNVNVVGGGTTSPPAATKAVLLEGHLGPLQGSDFAVSRAVVMKMTYLVIHGCSRYDFSLSRNNPGDFFEVSASGPTAFPIPMDIIRVQIINDDNVFGCDYSTSIVGY